MTSVQGRPRDPLLDTALLDAARELILERGYGLLSLQAVADRAGTSKPALYRRYADRIELVSSMLMQRFSIVPGNIDTGDLRSDLTEFLRRQMDLFTDPVLARSLCGLLDDLGRNSKQMTLFFDNFIEPRRTSTAEILRNAEDRDEIPPGTDPKWFCDLISGPFLMRAEVPMLGPIDDGLLKLTVESALATLGYHAS